MRAAPRTPLETALRLVELEARLAAVEEALALLIASPPDLPRLPDDLPDWLRRKPQAASSNTGS